MMVIHLGGPLQQTGMQVEHITWVGFSAGRSPQQQRHLSVGYGLFGQVIIDDQGMSTRVTEVFTNGTPTVGCQEL